MAENRHKVIVVLTHMDWSSGCDYIKQISVALAKTTKVVVFNPLYFPSISDLIFSAHSSRKKIQVPSHINNNLTHVKSFSFLPLQRFKLVNNINRFINLTLFSIYLKYKFPNKKIIFWVFHYSLRSCLAYFKGEKKIVYDRPDQMASIDKKENKIIKEEDEKLIKKSDYVLVNSPYSFRYVKKINKKTYQTPWGCEPNMFNNKIHPKNKTGIINKVRPPKLGFIAPLNFRVDYKLLYSLAKRNPDWNFILVGGVTDLNSNQNKIVKVAEWLSKLKTNPNILMLGQIDKSKIPSIINQFNIGLVLYDIKQEYNLGSNPMKVYEYLAGGKAVVSTPIEAILSHQPTIKIGKNVKEFEKHIKYHLNNNHTNKSVNYKKIVRANSWQTRIKYITQNILNDIR